MTGFPTNLEVAIRVFLQLAVIVGAGRIVGALLRRFGQTQVVSEMVTGVLLGPSLFGLLLPDLQQALFPKTLTLGTAGGPVAIPHPAMTVLYVLSQIALVLYMFVIGLQLDISVLRHHLRQTWVISLTGILLPVVLGGGLGVLLSRDDRLFVSGIAPWQAGLLLASAVAITAFPMLARILYEAGIAQTRLGTLAIGAAALDDAAAWSLLACVVATVKNSPSTAILALGGGLLYAAALVLVGRPLLGRMEKLAEAAGGVRIELLAFVLLLLMACAWLTDLIGIYSVFGAFILGAVMPRGRFANEVTQRLEELNVSLLLPTFFVYSGLNTQMALLVKPDLLGITIVIVLVSFVAKGLGCFAASWSLGTPWREASAVGVLMNARGLMELILVNIALEKGLITPGLFTILVLMAIVTTLMASPLFRMLYPPHRLRELMQ